MKMGLRWGFTFKNTFFYSFKHVFRKCQIVFYSLTYNELLDQSYAADVCMEPLFWFVDNFTTAIGPLFVIAVVALTSSVIFIAYWIGLPYWWNRNQYICVLLVIIGHWLLLNIGFHYYMAVRTPPGHLPQDEIIAEAVSICKKCITPKPPRTHHCSVCNCCILKMDHHCPWLNNCVGYGNHRYFFLYMAYMVVGVFFVIVAGFNIGYNVLMYYDYDEELEGHPVKFNNTGILVPVTDEVFVANPVMETNDTLGYEDYVHIDPWKRTAIIYAMIINISVFIALGTLTYWHYCLIRKGETSIEANINRTETQRHAEIGKTYVNPYNFGPKTNWKEFLGLVDGRNFWRHVLLPSAHVPVGDGLTWRTVHDTELDEEY